MRCFVYYDREGKKQIRQVKHGNPYRNAMPVDSSIMLGYMPKSEAENLTDYNPDYDVSEIMDINGYMKP